MCKDPENNHKDGKIGSAVKGLILPGLWYNFVRRSSCFTNHAVLKGGDYERG